MAHLDIEYGDLVTVFRGNNAGRSGVVIDIRYQEGLNSTLMYMMLDEKTNTTFRSRGFDLKLLTPSYLPQQ